MRRVLATTGCAVRLPLVSVAHDGKWELELTVTHRVYGLKKTETIRLTREELKLVGLAIFNALDWPEDNP